MNDDKQEVRLAAWLDGAMSEAESAAFEAELATDPDLAARAEGWKANDSFMAAALAPLAATPIDPAMLKKLGLAPQAANDNPPWWRRHALPLGGALAASLAAVMLLIPRGAPAPEDAVSLALETTPSLGQAQLADGRVLQPTLTTRAADGRWCREYRIGEMAGLACRVGKVWKVEAQGKAGAEVDTGEIGLASGPDSAALDAAYARLNASDPVDKAAEDRLIQNKWGER